ncbi:DUF4190 domain-containing protein [Sphaerisporangium sp. NPDC049002]|uniref:DUF4190 domain-containing protein n=1 Tax=unclassified Sphaerisporangium TaxID=2630420 RepID=UPI0033CCC999
MTTPGDPNNPHPWGDDPRGRHASSQPPYGEPPGGYPLGGQPPHGGEPPGGYPPGGYPPGGQPPYGQPPYGEPPGGQPPYGTPPYGGPPPYGQPPPGGWPAGGRRGGGLGTAALVLGIVSLFLLLICGVGVLTAIAGLIVGIMAVIRNSNKGRAIVGIVLSALTLILGIIGFTWFVNNFQECFTLPTQAEAQQCVERKLGVNVQTPSP